MIGQRDLATLYVEPGTDVERTIAGVLQRALGVSPVGLDDDFFELGGDSLRAMQVASSVCARFGVDVMDTLPFSQPTVRELARAVEEQLAARLDSLSDAEVERLLQSGADE